jgi:DNA-binding NtrC family response regulator
MTRVLVVHHDADMADEEAESLRRAGYEVQLCAGPNYGPCPILAGLPCPAVEDAEVLVYDVWSSGNSETERMLIETLREMYPELPVVLTAPGIEFDWVETIGIHGVVPLVGTAVGEPLRLAVERALESVAAAA